LPFALLGALAAVLLAAGHSAGASVVPAATTHTAVGTGHVTDGVFTLAHPRPTSPLPPVVPSAGISVGDRHAPPAITLADPAGRLPAAVPPTAIRGPPA
jgi:hypothetical protein